MGDTRDHLEENGGPGRRLCQISGTWVIAGSCPECPADNCNSGRDCKPCDICADTCPLWEDDEDEGGYDE